MKNDFQKLAVRPGMRMCAQAGAPGKGGLKRWSRMECDAGVATLMSQHYCREAISVTGRSQNQSSRLSGRSLVTFDAELTHFTPQG